MNLAVKLTKLISPSESLEKDKFVSSIEDVSLEASLLQEISRKIINMAEFLPSSDSITEFPTKAYLIEESMADSPKRLLKEHLHLIMDFITEQIRLGTMVVVDRASNQRSWKPERHWWPHQKVAQQLRILTKKKRKPTAGSSLMY
ncbi:hypothetical protein L1987_11459 [Smallanthus sonchifolius]|uniref:Uncharacterized protein n=1 Tax=Smallanthus sonchifolius TaxID=185202 RepID=A0ACB9JCL0_9ASTR|nr:hypothetical protein L1987_11459 [Smallanthus sonchifolius]